MRKKNSMTVNNQRIYICKSCGSNTTESLSHWKKKSQVAKNICPGCIASRKLKRQAAMEAAEDVGYSMSRYMI